VKLNKEIIIYGAGVTGEKILNEVRFLNGEVKYFIDRNQSKWDQNSVFSPNKLADADMNSIIVIASIVKTEQLTSFFSKYNLIENHNLFFYEPNLEDLFTGIFEENLWGDKHSVSGSGSNLVQTQKLIKEIPLVIEKYNIKTILDAPCGDFHWMKSMNLKVDYIGMDIVATLIKNNQIYRKTNIKFCEGDITLDVLPKADLIICRDMLVHFSNVKIKETIKNIKESGSTYLLTTTFIERSLNKDILTGDWRPINLQVSPYNFPTPLEIIDEECTEFDNQYKDKSLALWKISDL